MPQSRRASLKDRQQSTEAKGQEAIYGSPPPEPAFPAATATAFAAASTAEETGDGKPKTWEARHKRSTFYIPEDLEAAIRAEMAHSGRSYSRVIVDALRRDLG